MDTFQILVFASLLVMASISAISLAWAFYLDGKLRNRPAPRTYEVQVESAKIFTEEDIAAINARAMTDMHEASLRSAELLQKTLASSLSGLSAKTDEMATMTLSQEFEQYQASLGALREETIKEFSVLQKQLEERRVQLTVDLEKVAAQDRAERAEAFNARISDVVASYLVEALDKGVDLGAQSKYIVATLEAHKEEIKKDILA